MLVRPSRPPTVSPRVLPTSLDLPWEEAAGGTALVTLLSGIFARNGGKWWDWRSGITIATGVSAWVSTDGTTSFAQATGSKQPTWSSNGILYARASAQVLSGPNLSTLWGTTAYFWQGVLNPNASDSNQALFYNNAGIFISQNQNAGITQQTGTVQIRVGGINNVATTADDAKAISVGAFQCWEGRYTGGTLTARVAGVDGAGTALATPLASLASQAHLGGNPLIADYFDGTFRAFGTMPAPPSAADLAAARALITTIYGVAA